MKCAYVPEWILKSKDKAIAFSFIRGLFDTDGCVFCQKDYTKYASDFSSKYHSKIRLRITSISIKLINQVYDLCKKNGFRVVKRELKRGFSNNRNNNNVYILEVNELKSIKRWFKELKPSNLKHVSKYEVWKRFDFCPPNTTLLQRKEILKNQLNPYSLYMRG